NQLRKTRASSYPFLADAGSRPGNCSDMEEATGAPSSLTDWGPKRLRASGREGGRAMTTQPLSALTMLLSRHTRRREFITLLGGGVAGWPLAAHAQRPGKVWRIGFPLAVPREDFSRLYAGFHQGIQELGYVEGKDFVVEWRSAEGRYERLPEVAAELVRLNTSSLRD